MSKRVGSVLAQIKLEYDASEQLYYHNDPDITICSKVVQKVLKSKPPFVKLTLYRGNVQHGQPLSLQQKNTDCSFTAVCYSLSQKNKGRIKGRLYVDTDDTLRYLLPELGDGKQHQYTVRFQAQTR